MTADAACARAQDDPAPDNAALDAFVRLVGGRVWNARLAGLTNEPTANTRAGKALLQRHAIELTIERLRKRPNRPPTAVERRIAALAGDAVRAADALPPAGRDRLRDRLQAACRGDQSLVASFHVLRTARMQRDRGFAVGFEGAASGAPFDLLLSRDGAEAEVACDVFSAEAGRDLHRGAWFRLADTVDPDLQTWLAAHPGRYLLKLTLPQGLRSQDEDTLAAMHGRIRAMLAERRRSDQDAALVLRLDPLLLAAAQADELGLVPSLRREFGPEAHLSVTAGRTGVFVMAARAGREDDVALAARRHLAAMAPTRLTGTRPGILSLLVEDTDRAEWRSLRERLSLEGEARQFLTCSAARAVIAVCCMSRLELFGVTGTDAVPEGELRFRNPSHPAAKAAALAPAVTSCG